jgi:protein ImuA
MQHWYALGVCPWGLPLRSHIADPFPTGIETPLNIMLDRAGAGLYVPVMFNALDIPDPARSATRLPATSATPAARQKITRLRERIAKIEHAHSRQVSQDCLPLNVPAIDALLPGGGISLGALHEAASAGPDTEHAAAATLFTAGLLARLEGPVLWVLRQADLFAPGLAGVGLHPDRVIFAEAGKEVLPIAEEGLRHADLTAVVAEPTGRITLTASRRLQLAAEQSGVTMILIRRSQGFDDPALTAPTAAVTRWRVGMHPSPPAIPEAPEVPGLGRARWQLDLLRCRGGQSGSWAVEACDATGHLDLAADLATGSDQESPRLTA